MLARLWFVRQRWPALWEGSRSNRSDYDGRPPPRVIIFLPTERASCEAFQLSVYANDREEWPRLSEAAHVRGIIEQVRRWRGRR